MKIFKAPFSKDKSVATLFQKRENGDKVPLVIKCDKRDLEKLSLLIVAEEGPQVIPLVAKNQISAADEILKLKKLLDDGILTKEELDAKKKQLLGI